MLRESFQILAIFILFTIIPHIIIFNTVLKRQSFNQQIQQYTLKEIVHSQEANLMLESILQKIKSALNLDQIRKENWKFTKLKLDLEIIHQKTEERNEKRSQILNKYFRTKRQSLSTSQ